MGAQEEGGKGQAVVFVLKMFLLLEKQEWARGQGIFYSVNRVFVFCQNKEFGCDWQGIYGDCAEHLAKSCFAVQPENLLKRLEASEKYADALSGQLAASRVKIDDLQDENRTLREENADLHKKASDRLGQKYILEAEVAQMKEDIEARAKKVVEMEARATALQEDGSRMLIDLKILEDENLSLRGRNHAQLRGRNRLIWNLEEKLKRALRKRGRRDDSSRRGGSSPKRRRRHSSTARGSKHPPSRAVVDLEDEQERPAPWRCNDGSPPPVALDYWASLLMHT